MGTQLPLPAGWARQFASMPDPRDRLDALEHAKIAARTEIRRALSRLANEFDVRTGEMARAMDHVGDTITDLVWEVENGCRHEIEEGHPL
jgi:hypothetical protein